VKIGIIATASWPVPNHAHTGDHFYAGLVKTLDELGHDVTFFAADGSYVPPHGKQLSMPCSWGTGDPHSSQCEQWCYEKYEKELLEQDIVHDFSITKRIAENLYNRGYKNTISQPLGGVWTHPDPPHNFIVASEAMRQRALRGATDYENTPWPTSGGPPQKPIKEAHVVFHSIDTDFYFPTYKKDNFFLWLGRWHRVRGFHLAIQLARETGIELVMAGEHPDRGVCDYQRECSFEAVELAKDLPNVHFEWLPADPYHHEAKRDLIQRARALLFPVQFQEPFGLMQPEALACGTPVIGTNYGSVPEVIQDGITGYVVNNSVQDFANALPKIDSIIPAICRADAVKRFDRHVMTANYLKEYELVINGSSW
jgi:glycosyltransferase involved in cell wall biosynthesis